MTSLSIPVELMDILNRINDNVNEVKERLARLEAADHADRIKVLKLEIEKERDQRIALQVELSSIKTKLAPITIGVSLIGAGIIQFIAKIL